MKKTLAILFFILSASFLTPCTAQYSVLLTFTNTSGPYIGELPFGSLTRSGDTLYGMTKQGGIYPSERGVIFSVQTDGTNYKDLFNFNDSLGEFPGGSLILSGTTLYGMATAGGRYGYGDIFSIQTNGTNFIDLLNFTGDTGSCIGAYPQYGSLILSGDTLYGMTTEAYNGLDYIGNGTIIGNGNIFSIQTNGTNYKDLIDFTADSGSYPGKWPYGSLILSGDTLYGMTSEGGINGDGNIFSVETRGTNFRDLIDFTGSFGSYAGKMPAGSLILSGDTLYGMTGTGGPWTVGNIFSVQANGTNFKNLLNFSTTNIGGDPFGSLTLSGNTLYGMTTFGGTGGYGTLFSVQTNGTNFTNLLSLTSTTGSYMGALPFGSLTLSGRTLYGMTSEQAYSYLGNIFKFDLGICTFSATASAITNENCIGGNGVAAANPNGGMPPYTYTWNNGQTSSTATGLSAGIYSVSIIDSAGCTGSATVAITQPPPLLLTADSINTTGVGNCDGSAWAIANGGNAPYTYSWSPGGLTNDTISNQCAGGYCCSITDANGCMESICTNIETSTGTNQVKGESEKMKVFPNPSNGLFTLQWSVGSSQSSDVQMSVINELGQIVYSNNITGANGTLRTAGTYTEQLNLSNLASGIYTLRVESNSGIFIRKLEIIQR